jgi:hypothetical protein
MTRTAVTIQVPSEDPKKERKDDVKDVPDKDKDKEGEDLVGVSSRIPSFSIPYLFF